ncbi:MAG: hypothetical protein IJV28_04350 [Paludibacteraceae bacterium]|nr:hypothetical protein [Paludibacteraceae bacterium]
MESVFIVNYGYDSSWIVGKLARDIESSLQKAGIPCRNGELDDYNGEEIVFHMQYHWASPIPTAKHNSVFYTHTINVLYETDIQMLKDRFDSFICMSPEDAQYLIELGFDQSKVFGRILPIRTPFIKPISIGIFSACYGNHVKNEQWLIDYCTRNPDAKYANFVFVGKGWGGVCEALENLGCTYEWHNVSRSLPYEYLFQINKLANLNYYIYMGMDGGAMGTYDAYAVDVPLCVTFDGFHKAIPNVDYTFDNEQTFFKQMDIIIAKHVNRIRFFEENTSDNYTQWILKVWHGESVEQPNEDDKRCITYKTIVDKKREHYFTLTKGGIKRWITWKINQYKQSEKLYKKFMELTTYKPDK